MSRNSIVVMTKAVFMGLLCLSMPVLFILAVSIFGFLGNYFFPSYFGDSVAWQGGTVRIFDCCLHPGTYDTYVEWRREHGSRKVLLHVGDDVPQLRVLDTGELEATYMIANNRSCTGVSVIWRNPDGTPVREEVVRKNGP